MNEVSNLIQKLSNKGKMIFVVTHDYEFICRACTRILHFNKGVVTDDLNISIENIKKIKKILNIE